MADANGKNTNKSCAYRMNAAAQTVGGAILSALRREFGARRHGTKLLARAGGVTPGAARNWLDGNCVPQAEQLVRLMARSRELRAEVNALCDAIEAGEGRVPREARWPR